MDAYTKYLLHFEESITKDECGNTWTEGGDPGAGWSSGTKKFGTHSLAAINGFIYTDAPSLGYLDWTIEWWEYVPSSLGTFTGEVVVIEAPGTNYVNKLNIGYINSEYPMLYLSNTYDRWDLINGEIIGEKLRNRWVYRAIVRYQNSIQVFQNAKRLFGKDIGNISLGGGGYVLSIGGYTRGTRHFKGYIDEFRFTLGIARYTDEVIAVPEAPFTYPDTVIRYRPKLYTPSEHCIALMHFDNSWGANEYKGVIWQSNTKPGVSATNAKFKTAMNKTANAGNVFSTFEIGGQDFTIDGWCYFNSASTDYARIFECYPEGYNTSNALAFELNRQQGVPRLVLRYVSKASDLYKFNMNELFHFAVVYKHEEATSYVFHNGKLVTSLQANIPRMSRYFAIGGNTSGQTTVADYSEFRILDGYAAWTRDFTPPTEPYKLTYPIILTTGEVGKPRLCVRINGQTYYARLYRNTAYFRSSPIRVRAKGTTYAVASY